MGWFDLPSTVKKMATPFTAPIAVDPMAQASVQQQQTTGTAVAPSAVGVPMPTVAVPTQPMVNYAQPQTFTFAPTPSPTPAPANPYQPGTLFRGTDPTIAQGYTKTLSDALTGKIYDPMAAGTAEALARSEANQRAKTGSQIAGAGMAGQGIGRQIAAGTESDLTRNRFATNIGIEQARAEGRLAALPQALDYAKAQQKVTSESGANFAAFVQARPGIEKYTAEQVAADPALMASGRELWTSLGLEGEPTSEWVRQQVAYATDPRVTSGTAATLYEIDRLADGGYISAEDADIMRKVATSYTTQYFSTDPETGRLTFDWDAFNADNGGGATPGEPTTMTVPTDTQVGGSFTQDGKLYVKDSATTAHEIAAVPDDPWGNDANAIVAAGSSNQYYNSVIESRATDIVDNDNFNRLRGLSADDPLYKKVLENVQPLASFSYRNRAGYNDEFTGAPNVGDWVKISVNGAYRMLRVTFNGHLNTAGTSDRAYMEFQDADGDMYSTQGNSTNVAPGVNTKFTKK